MAGWDNESLGGSAGLASNPYTPLAQPSGESTTDSFGSQTSQGSGSSFTGITDPQLLSILKTAIQQFAGGGTPDYQAQRAVRNEQIAATRAAAGQYSKQAAFADAADLMAQNLRLSLEKNMPVINKAIQGAGTSADSMQALLSQKLATESAQAAGALGATQAAQYGQIQSTLQGVLENLTRIDNSQVEALVNALNVARTTTSTQQNTGQQRNSTVTRTAPGGGQSFVPNPNYSSGGGWGGSNFVAPDISYNNSGGYIDITPYTGDYGGTSSYNNGSIIITPVEDSYTDPYADSYTDYYEDPYADYYESGGYGYL